MPQITLVNAIFGGATLAMTVAATFMGIVAAKTYDLAEQFGRIDTRLGVVEGEFKTQTKQLGGINAKLEAGFETMNSRFDRIDLRIGQMELSPEKLLGEHAIAFEKDLKAVFYGGNVYALTHTEEAAARLQTAGYKRELLQGFLPAFLVIKDAFPPVETGQ